jgi:hypothetical protein
METVLNACIPAAADPNWWALASIGCGIFVLGTALGALLGVALAHEAYSGIRVETDVYDPRSPG